MLNIIASTLGIIVRNKALPPEIIGETVALPYLPDFSQYHDKLKTNTDIAAILPDYGEPSDRGKPLIGNNTDVISGSSGFLTDLIPDKITDLLSKAEKEFLFAIFAYLCEHGEINNYRAQTITGKSAESVKKYFAQLVQIGVLQAIGNNKARIYRFVD